MDYLGLFGPKKFRLPQSKEKSMSQIELTWGNRQSCFWVMCPWISIRGKERWSRVIMVEDLKGILGMVSLDIYQITNYSSFQKSISFAWFSKGLGFSWTPKCDYAKPGFIQFKISLSEISMFWLNWLRRWESVYPKGFIPNNDHKFSSLRQFTNHSSLFHVSEIFRI